MLHPDGSFGSASHQKLRLIDVAEQKGLRSVIISHLLHAHYYWLLSEGSCANISSTGAKAKVVHGNQWMGG